MIKIIKLKESIRIIENGEIDQIIGQELHEILNEYLSSGFEIVNIENSEFTLDIKQDEKYLVIYNNNGNYYRNILNEYNTHLIKIYIGGEIYLRDTDEYPTEIKESHLMITDVSFCSEKLKFNLLKICKNNFDLLGAVKHDLTNAI